MQIIRDLQKRQALEEFADEHNLVMEVHERDFLSSRCDVLGRRAVMPFYASFRCAEVKSDGVLTSTIGEGETEQEAIADYAYRISGTVLVIDAYKETRLEIRVPILEVRPSRFCYILEHHPFAIGYLDCPKCAEAQATKAG